MVRLFFFLSFFRGKWLCKINPVHSLGFLSRFLVHDVIVHRHEPDLGDTTMRLGTFVRPEGQVSIFRNEREDFEQPVGQDSSRRPVSPTVFVSGSVSVRHSPCRPVWTYVCTRIRDKCQYRYILPGVLVVKHDSLSVSSRSSRFTGRLYLYELNES